MNKKKRFPKSIVQVGYQPAYSLPRLILLFCRYPGNVNIIGPDTALINWQLARKLKMWKWADRIRAKFEELEPDMTMAFCQDHYEVHQDEMYSYHDAWERMMAMGQSSSDLKSEEENESISSA